MILAAMSGAFSNLTAAVCVPDPSPAKSTKGFIPEDLISLIPEELSIEKRLNWLAKNKAKLLKPIAPDIGAGQRGSGTGKKTRVLTPEERQVAKTFGYSEEEYIEHLDAE